MEKLQVEGLSYKIEKKEILHNINLEIVENKFIGIIGPNGSGKSTFLKTISRALSPEKGTIYLDGNEITHLSYKKTAKLMACLAQEHDIPFHFQVKDLVMMGRYPYKKLLETETSQDEEIVEEAIRQVGIEKLTTKNFYHLSGGEKQRVLIARMLAQKSEFLILDEPTNHLDIHHQLELFDFLKELKTTIISAVHDLNIAAMYCDYLYVFQEGEIVASGTPENILTTQLLADIFKISAEVYLHPSKKYPIIIYNRKEVIK